MLFSNFQPRFFRPNCKFCRNCCLRCISVMRTFLGHGCSPMDRVPPPIHDHNFIKARWGGASSVWSHHSPFLSCQSWTPPPPGGVGKERPWLGFCNAVFLRFPLFLPLFTTSGWNRPPPQPLVLSPSVGHDSVASISLGAKNTGAVTTGVSAVIQRGLGWISAEDCRRRDCQGLSGTARDWNSWTGTVRGPVHLFLQMGHEKWKREYFVRKRHANTYEPSGLGVVFPKGWDLGDDAVVVWCDSMGFFCSQFFIGELKVVAYLHEIISFPKNQDHFFSAQQPS